MSKINFDIWNVNGLDCCLSPPAYFFFKSIHENSLIQIPQTSCSDRNANKTKCEYGNTPQQNPIHNNKNNHQFHSLYFSMVSDFFYPNMGGVEEHILNLSECLLSRGHKVRRILISSARQSSSQWRTDTKIPLNVCFQIVVITHSYNERKGVRYMTQGLKVYYLPIKTFYNQCVLPTMFCNIPLLRNVLLREQIDIVHGHSAFSALAHEAMYVGKLLGLRVINR